MAADRKKTTAEADDAFLEVVSKQGKRGSVLGVTKEDIQSSDPPVPGATESEGSRRVKLCGYDELLYGNIELRSRSPRTIYVSEQTHAKLNAIVNRLTGGRVTVSSYVENIFAQHFEIYGDEINERNEKLNKDKLIRR